MVHGISVMISVTLLSFVRDGDGDVSDAIDSDEDSALKDALLLVDILKSAYVKVLKENGDLRAGSDTTAELSTCPTTIATNTTPIRNVSTIRVPLTQPISSPATWDAVSDKNSYNWSPPPFYRSNPRNYRRYPPMYYRRYINMNRPLDYYYYDLDKFRRFNYEDAFGAHPNETATKDVGAHKKTTSSIGTTFTTMEAKITMPTSIQPKIQRSFKSDEINFTR
ncbi:uncharacterized protein LOC115441174 [Manduca sexta]|uniref:uncharacterized protein LOC115441174 n=1 Tax=Manduca sexta TaxID=7130 RepID=UPI00189019F9|nr:uncharacterized protein LOC115441174 [Manduca sexta]